MSSPTPPSAFLDGRVPHGGHAFSWLLGCLATACGIFGLAALISAESEREAGRMIAAAEDGAGTIAIVTYAYAANQGRPYRY